MYNTTYFINKNEKNKFSILVNIWITIASFNGKLSETIILGVLLFMNVAPQNFLLQNRIYTKFLFSLHPVYIVSVRWHEYAVAGIPF